MFLTRLMDVLTDAYSRSSGAMDFVDEKSPLRSGSMAEAVALAGLKSAARPSAGRAKDANSGFWVNGFDYRLNARLGFARVKPRPRGWRSRR